MTRKPYSRAQIREHDKEYAPILRQMRDLLRTHDAMVRRGDQDRVDAALVGLHELRDYVLYQHRIWTERGRWNRYYQVQSDGAAHMSLTCRTVTNSTLVYLNWTLSGMDRRSVAEILKLCRHCGGVDTGDVPESVFQQFFREHHLLDG
jgi:hypothetical protein